MIHSSAPGKLMIFGEHSVVYGNPCIVTSVNKRIDVYLNDKDKSGKEMNDTIIDALGITARFPSDAQQHKFLNLTIAKFFEKYGRKNFKLITKTIPKGLGSSSAVVVATVQCLSAFYNLNLNNDEIFKFSYDIVREVQGKASGYDIAVAVYGGTLRYENRGDDRSKDKIVIKKLKGIKNLIAIYTGLPSSTTELVKEISEKRERYKDVFDGNFKIINKIVEKGEYEITKENLKGLGELMNINHGILNGMGLSTYNIENLINKIMPYCYGAKISGAGKGDYVITIYKEERKKDLMDLLKYLKVENFEISQDKGVDFKIMDLEEYRKKIDEIDAKIGKLLKERIEIIKEVGILKANTNISVRDNKRIKKIYKNLSENTGLCIADAEKIYSPLIRYCILIEEESVKEEMKKRRK